MNQNPGKLAGKNAIVTGASKGIGSAIATQLAASGASVAVNYSSDQKGAQAIVDRITADGGKAIAIHADMAEPADIARLFKEASSLGPLDILVNNAGIYDMAPLGSITPEHFHRIVNINVLGAILAMQEALAYFRPEGGCIINTSSIVSREAPAGAGVYNATKAAIDSLTRTFAMELGSRNIRVNTVNPGPIETDGVRNQGLTDGFRAMGAGTALGRVGYPEDIAPGVVYLASDEAAWMTGEHLHINGGLRWKP